MNLSIGYGLKNSPSILKITTVNCIDDKKIHSNLKKPDGPQETANSIKAQTDLPLVNANCK